MLPCNFPLANRGNFSDSVTRDGVQLQGRLDHTWNNANDRLYFNFYRTQRDTVTFAAPSVYPVFSPIQPEHTSFANLNYTHTFSPTLLNEASLAGTRAWGFVPLNRGEIPNVSVPGIESYGQGFSDATFIQNNLEWKNVLTWIRGEHSFKFGGNFARESGFRGAGAFFGPVWERPQYFFLNLYDFALDQPFSQSNIGIDPRTGQSTGPSFRPIFDRLGWFIQDDWKVRPNLTLSFGLRWEAFLNPDTHGDNFTNIEFRGGNNFFERIANAAMVIKRPYDENDLNNFAPRFGLAWDPTGEGRLSIRLGAGIFYDRPAGQFFHDCCTSLPIFAVVGVSQQTELKPVYGLSRTKQKPWDFPLPPLQPQLNERGGLLGAQATADANDPLLRNQYSGNWFLGVQYALSPNWVVEADYIGSVGRKLYQAYDVNRVNGDLFDGRLDRLNPFFGTIQYAQANGSSSYNGATFSLRRRYSDGLDFQTAYTVGKAIDTASSFGRGLPMVDINNLNLNRGLSNFDIRQKLATSLLWEIPAPDLGGAAGKFLQGWQIGAITIVQSGSPYSVFCTLPFRPVRDSAGNLTGNSGCDFNADGFNNDFLNEASFGNFKKGGKQDFINGIFQVSDFPKPGIGQNGTLGRNTFIGPGFVNTDLNVVKKTAIPWFTSEGARLEFRAEFLNLFNRVNLQNPQGNIASGNFGRSTGTFPARNIQFGLRIVY